MATIRKFCCNDLLRFASVNLDHLVVTTTMSIYLNCLAKWSDYFLVAVAPGNRVIGYIIGVTEEVTEEDSNGAQWKVIAVTEEDFEKSEDKHWKGLAVAVNVASEYRRQGLATRLVQLFEKHLVEKMRLSPRDHEYYMFVYVLIDNTPAKKMFEQRGYKVTRISPDFYMKNENEGEDSNEMRKELSEE